MSSYHKRVKPLLFTLRQLLSNCIWRTKHCCGLCAILLYSISTHPRSHTAKMYWHEWRIPKPLFSTSPTSRNRSRAWPLPTVRTSPKGPALAKRLASLAAETAEVKFLLRILSLQTLRWEEIWHAYKNTSVVKCEASFQSENGQFRALLLWKEILTIVKTTTARRETWLSTFF